MMMPIILQFFVVMTLCCVVHGQCEKLTITGESGQMNTSSVCQRMYKGADCLKFYNSFNITDLPEGYPRKSPEVEEPSEINIDGLSSPYNGKLYPGLSIRWKAPKSGNARMSCYGYLVVWFTKDDITDNSTKCRLFLIQENINAEFKFDVDFVAEGKGYTVRVHSMPPYGIEYKYDEGTFVYKKVFTSSSYNIGEPGNWTPFIVYKAFHDGTINMSFTLPPANYNITHFRMFLVDESDNNVLVKNLTAPRRTEENTQFSLSLTVEYSGKYQFVIWVIDEYRKQDGLCQCWEMLNNERTCKNICGGVTTDFFYVNITDPRPAITTSPLPRPETTTSTAQSPGPETTTSTVLSTSTRISTLMTYPTAESIDGSNNDSQKYILFGVFGFLVLVILLGLALLCLCRKNKKVKQLIPKQIIKLMHGSADKDIFVSTIDQEKPGITTKSAVAHLTRKTVYFMSAGDHEAHNELVNSIVAFLQEHCHCNVIIPSDNDEREDGAYKWFLSRIIKSDYIIFMNSEGAFRMIEANLDNKIYSNKIGPVNEIFISGLKHIMLNAEVRDKQLCLISFSGNQCQKFLEVPETYMLPAHLPRLLKKIHGITTKLYSNSFPLIADNIPELSGGARMLSARKNVEIYEKNNPKWFENSFGDLKPGPLFIGRENSDDSGCQSLPPESLDVIDSVSRIFTPDYHPDTNIHNVKNVSAGNGLGYEKSAHFDGFSCITVNEHDRTLSNQKQQASSVIGAFSVIPPDTESNINCDSYSEALQQINETSARQAHQSLPAVNFNNFRDHEFMTLNEDSQTTVIPPDNPADINVDKS